ncbi:glycosyltransferase family 4 protein [Desertihabitans aurantiacus]|uniref:glycosyltransferase family 4 protein n=1 Tax=Desertihabitans aurantiacus TaxID=2282477 RepID=UPI000DF74F53|nr:glycosyltransferase family 4 protein [Desertihabitans aurantiacus]
MIEGPTPTPSPTGTPQKESDRARERADQRRAEARRLWESGKRESALDVMRRSLLADPGNAADWHLYGSRLLQAKKFDAAFEAIKNAIDIDPVRVSSLELLEVMVNRPGVKPDKKVVKKALDRMTEKLARRPETHLDALAFAIGYQHQPSLDVLAGSPNPVVQLAVRLNASPREEWQGILAGADEKEARLARMHTVLARGGASQAADVLAELRTSEIPLIPLRLAIRRVSRKGYHTRAGLLLRHYRRAKPNDKWAREKFAGTEVTDNVSQQLLNHGFPMPALRSEPEFEVDRAKFLYGLHNSLPYHSAGYATRTHGLLSALARAGWDAHGVTRRGYPFDMPKFRELDRIEPLDHVDGIPYHRLSTEPGPEPKLPTEDYIARYAASLEPLVRQERPFVLHAASNHWNGLTLVSTARRLGLPSIYEVRGLWEVTRASRDPFWAEGRKYRLISRLEADAARYATKTIAITQALKDELVTRGVEADQITVVPNGVDTDRFVPRAPDLELADRLGVRGKKVIGYVGTIVDYEGLELLVEAAGVLSRERSDFVVLVIGDGNALEDLTQRVVDEGLTDVVKLLGRVPHEEVESYYSIIDVCPLPRLPLPVCEMVSPLKPFEAMAMGKVVVASDVAALAEIVEDGLNGMLHTKGDAASLTEKLRLLLDDSELRVRLSAQAREWVVQNRRWDVLAERITELYEEIGGVRRPVELG